MLTHCCTTLILALVLSAVSVGAVDRYVQKTGSSDGNACTLAAPCLTITRGLQAMSGQETLYIRAGTYNSLSVYTVNKSGTSGTKTTIRSFPGDTVILQRASTGGDDYMMQIPGGTSHVVIDGLIFDGKNNGGTYTTAYLLVSDRFTGVNNITLRNNTFKNSFASGLLISGDNYIIEDNTIETNGSNLEFDHGIYHSGNNTIIRRNTFRANGGYNIHLYPFGSNITIEANTLTGSSQGFTATLINGITFKNNFMYNDAYNQRSIGLSACTGSSNSKVFNNTFNAVGLFFRNDCGGTNEVRNNIFSGSPSGVTDETGNVIINTNFTGSPSFVNAGAGNFHLNSPNACCINTGATIASVTIDIDGNTRTAGSYDIGADEFGGAVFQQRHLAFTNVSSNSVVGVAMTPALVIEIHLPDHSVDTTATDSIALTKLVCGGTMTCGAGTCTRNAVAGSLTFSDIVFSAPGTNCQHSITATFSTGGSDTELSNTFNVVAVPPTDPPDTVRQKGSTGFFFKQ